MPYRAQFSQGHDTTHDATQSAALREQVSSLLQPAMELPSSGTLLCGPFLPATPSPSAKAIIPALRAKPRKPSLLRDSVPGARQEAPQSSALRLCRPPLRSAPSTPLSLRSKGGEPHLLHLPPLLAWARAKACLLANTARPFKNGGTTHEQHCHHERNQQRHFSSHRTQAA